MPPLMVVMMTAARAMSMKLWSMPCLSVPSDSFPIMMPAKNPCIMSSPKKVLSRLVTVLIPVPGSGSVSGGSVPDMLPSFGNSHSCMVSMMPMNKR